MRCLSCLLLLVVPPVTTTYWGDDWSLSELVSMASENLSFWRRAWIAVSSFDYADPSRDILNVAYPSATSVYFITMVPKGQTYVFEGDFPTGDGVFQVNLMAYTSEGNLDLSYPPIFDYNSVAPHRFTVAATERRIVIQRFYLDPEMYSLDDMEHLLFRVSNKDRNIPFFNPRLRIILSEALERPISNFVADRAPERNVTTPTPFFLPGQTSSLFPDISHAYLVAFPTANVAKATISGSFTLSKDRPYFDFIVCNQHTTQTDDALPGYVLQQSSSSYTLDVLNPASSSSDGATSWSIQWKPDNLLPIIIMRFITYDYDVTDYSGPLTPAQTKDLLPDIYPTISYTGL